mgnify:CR=1 FL=1|jgi:hypothetical protein
MSGNARRFRPEKIDAAGVEELNNSDYIVQSGTCEVYEVVLKVNGDGALEAGADQWSKTKNTNTVDAAMFFAQTCILQMERQKEEGSMSPAISYEQSPKQWQELCMLAAKMKMGCANAEERTKVQSLMIKSDSVNIRFNKDIETAKERQKIINLNAKNKKNGKNNGNPNKRQKKKNNVMKKPEAINLNWLREDDIVFDERVNRSDDNVVQDTFLARSAVTIKQITENTAYDEFIRLNPIQEEEEPEAEDDGNEKLPEWIDWDEDARSIYPKMKMTLTPVPLDGQDPKKEENIVAIVLRFLVYDPAIVLGDFFKRLVENHEVRRQGAANATKSRYGKNTEMFPAYSSFYNTNHPVGSNTNRWTYFKAAMDYDPSLKELIGRTSYLQNEGDLFSQMRQYIRGSHFAADRVLCWENASRILSECGVDPLHCQKSSWYEGADITYPHDLQTYDYKVVFYYSPDHIGLFEQRFPYINTDQDYLAQIMAGGDPRTFVGDNGEELLPDDTYNYLKEVSSHLQDLRKTIKTSPMVKRSDIQNQQLVKYHTMNEYIYRYAEMLRIYSSVMKHYPKHYRATWIEVFEFKAAKGYDELDHRWLESDIDPDLKRRVDECRGYQAMAVRIREALMKVFKSLWVLDGNIDDLPISEPVKIMLKWMRDNFFPNLTRDFMMYDLEVGMFGNCILRMNEMFVSISKIVHPSLCILWIGLFCVYSLKRELKFNMMGHGWRATGKTKTVLDTPKAYICIPGTTESFTTSTAASDTTDNHRYDWIYLMDETEGYKVDPKEAEKNQPLVNKAKVKMVEQQVGHNVFMQIINPDGTTGRWSRVVTTDHFCVSVEVTNKEVSQKDALASRYYRFSMPMPKVPIYELGGSIPEDMKSMTQKYMRIGQYLMCCAMKASAVGAILPEPEKELWSDMSSRVIDQLVDLGAVERDDAMRGLDIMWPLVRQYVYMWAVHCAFDMPGSANYKKKFEVGDIKEVEPYLYVTMEIFWFCWTALASQWVDDNRAKLIRAVEKRSGYTKVKDSIPEDSLSNTNYCVFENDVEGSVSFHTYPDPNAEKGNKDNQIRGDDKLVDMTCVIIPGTLDQVCTALAKESGLSPTDVHGLVNEMKHMMHVPPGGAYQPMPFGSAKYFHRFINSNQRNKRTDVGDHTTMPAAFLKTNPDRTQPRTESDVTRDGVDKAYSVVRIEKDKVIFMVNIADMYRSNIIIDALIHATVCEDFPEQKFILGIPCEDSSTMLQHYNFNRSVLDAQIAYLDEDQGWLWNADTESLTWVGDPNMKADERPISRRDGVSINRRIAISESKRPFFEVVPTQPTERGDESWRSIGKSLDSLKDCRISISNFDEESALRCHLAIGRGFDDPVLTPKYIRARFEHASKEEGVQWTANKQYPQDIKADELQRERVFKRKRYRDFKGNNRKDPAKRAKEWAAIQKLQQTTDPIRSPETRDKMDRDVSRDNFVPPAILRPAPKRIADEAVVPRAGVHARKKRGKPDVLGQRMENTI